MKNELIKLFESSYHSPKEIIEKFKKILEDQPNDYFGKKSNIAHITGSVLIVNDDASEVLLTNHKKLKKWLQLGGHWCDFDSEPTETITQAAIREVREEGYNNKEIPIEMLNSGNILDLDIHDVGGHLHYDVCFLAKVSKSVPIHVSYESEDLEWKNISAMIESKEVYDDRLIRMLEKTQQITKKNVSQIKFK